MSEFKRPSFGQIVPIGTLYDARVDKFLEASILPANPPPEAITIIQNPSGEFSTKYAFRPNHTSRFMAMNIDNNLAASVISGLIEPRGPAAYLNEGNSAQDRLCRIIYHTRLGYTESLNLGSDYYKGLALQLPRLRGSSHVVIQAQWGLQSVMVVRHPIKNEKERASIKKSFNDDLNEFVEILHSSTSTDLDCDSLSSRLGLIDYELMLYTDVHGEEGIRHKTMSSMLKFMRLGPEHIRAHDDGRGYLISYTLIPTSVLYDPPSYGTIVPNPFDLGIASKDVVLFMLLFDGFNDGKQKLETYRHFLQSKKPYIPKHHIEDVEAAMSKLCLARDAVRKMLRKILVGVKEKTMHYRRLKELHTHINDSEYSPGKFSTIAGQASGKISFIDECMNLGATYIGFNDLSLPSITDPHSDPLTYFFLFSNAMLKDSPSWHDQRTLLRNFLKKPDRPNQVYIVDCEALSQYRHMECPYFGTYQGLPTNATGGRKFQKTSSNRQPIAEEPVSQRNSNSCIALCDQDFMDVSGAQRNTQHCPVKIPCPGPYCDGRVRQEWLCGDCYMPIEFQTSGDYICCHCGRGIYSAWTFRCNSEHHGEGYDCYPLDDLHRVLKQPNQPDCRNILILGETGVGKSTLINSFVNYFTFESFDEAKAASKIKLQYVVPCSFSISCRRPSDPYGPREKQKITIGSWNNGHERDGTEGDSATQKASVYRMAQGTTTYRLIDTPGMGDTRGPEQDRKNMRDILESLSGFKDLHCILILLKTDQARITATFEFCFEELLSYFHRSAADNIFFGFTHASKSDYAPGESFRPLECLLKKHTDDSLSLSRETAYSFDAENFRHLAAYNKGSIYGIESNCRESWDSSKAETMRLLEHIDRLKPHDISQTFGMNEARRAIRQLMIPMVDISQEIKKNMHSLDDQVKALEDRRLTGDKLRSKLHLERIKLDPERLDKPRTVCASKECCDYKSNLNGEVITIYKQVCHADCKLRNVTSDRLGAPELISCRPFKESRDGLCKECGHHWREHMHHYYDLKEVKVKVKDKEIERQLLENMSDVTLRKEGIERFQRTQQEYRNEHEQVQKAAARFVAYLKDNAIILTNDATEAYYDQLIKLEETNIQKGKEMKIGVEGNKAKLKSLNQDKSEYLELVDTIRNSMHISYKSKKQLRTQEDIEDEINKLFNLKHFGSSFRNLEDVIISSKPKALRKQPSHRRRNSSFKTEPKGVRFDEDVGQA
ncbi:Ff.00g108450.m01.CDS01 [Fusarium sp. VM40]|nr:Ff.00g108450.m01.CDS01 [Fusarium sp. VM40]